MRFQPGGLVGYAVSAIGDVFRSTDGGASWARLAPLPPTVAGAQGFGEDACSDASLPAPMAAPVPPLYGVTWAGPSTVYITGGLDGAGPGDVACTRRRTRRLRCPPSPS